MRIELFHDTVCPWCRIGKQNMLTALSEWTGEPVELSIRAYMLDASIPVEGLPFKETMQKKFGGQVDLSQVFSQVTEAGKGAGLAFDFDKVGFMPNTRMSHRLIAIVQQESKLSMLEAINKAYFEDGRDIGSLEVLLKLAQETGIETAGLRERLTGGEGEEEVAQDLAYGHDVGITGVPFFIIDGKYALTGAQPPSVFTQVLQKIAEEKSNG
ncbi:DsbA family oxidoreductase [Paenibacillus sp. H1-7]|uniref:DsbA family oxidoreductase n=1 Tax=Paenibacillus sp. H1-7 TaxID=2282849 RepID=UPI001EF7C5A4|nr:DsbA family oxidoreductase [Paenibacillus sp. H1-7]ULL13198.1 DsbA family oxidoreductase [Paenibacillus sp. H1-7]